MGLGRQLPVVGHVELFLGDERQQKITAARAQATSSWQLCPDGAYSERECPLSAFQTLADGRGAMGGTPPST